MNAAIENALHTGDSSHLNCVPYSIARSQILDGDLLLCRGKGILTLGGKYTHAAMAGWWGDVLMQLEMLQGWGGRAITVSRSVQIRLDCTVDVYRPIHLTDSHRKAVLSQMARKVGEKYNWSGLIRTAAKHTVLGSWLFGKIFGSREDSDDTCCPHHAEFCSEAYSSAFRVGSGIDAVPNCLDSDTEPMFLARSSEFKYLLTLQRDPEMDGLVAEKTVASMAAGAGSGACGEGAASPLSRKECKGHWLSPAFSFAAAVMAVVILLAGCRPVLPIPVGKLPLPPIKPTVNVNVQLPPHRPLVVVNPRNPRRPNPAQPYPYYHPKPYRPWIRVPYPVVQPQPQPVQPPACPGPNCPQ